MPDRASNRAEIHRWIVERAPQGGRVLDIGCGDGELLARLAEERGVRGTGIELDEACVLKAIQRGLSVHHGNVEEGLDHYANSRFDPRDSQPDNSGIEQTQGCDPRGLPRREARDHRLSQLRPLAIEVATGRPGARPENLELALHMVRFPQPPLSNHRGLGGVLRIRKNPNRRACFPESWPPSRSGAQPPGRGRSLSPRSPPARPPNPHPCSGEIRNKAVIVRPFVQAAFIPREALL